ncbi:MAG: polyprenyl synthetase family protein [Parachlamydiales bacterium]|nr:polyprenyl synthetase family protein [Parachlamydiales bacterium]
MSNSSTTAESKYKGIYQVLARYKKLVEDKMRVCLDEMNGVAALKEAIEYSLVSNGKRFRPIIVFMMAKALGKGFDVTPSALAVEFFHTASLVADDLPCMDDEEFRREKPTLHTIFGEAKSLLVTYSLIATGYGFISKNGSLIPLEDSNERCLLALDNASKNTGASGAAGGQFLDLFPQERSLNALKEMLRLKTVTLFEVAFIFGWLFGGGDLSLIENVKKIADHWGHAFQIADDFSDFHQDEGRFVNIVQEMGPEGAYNLFNGHIQSLKECFKTLPIDSSEFLEMVSSLEQSAQEQMNSMA